MEFKDRLRALREEKKISAAQLAGAFEKSEGAVRMWETGRTKPDADTLIVLSKYFGVTTDYLLGLSNIKNHEEYTFADMKIKDIISLVEASHYKPNDFYDDLFRILLLAADRSVSAESSPKTSFFDMLHITALACDGAVNLLDDRNPPITFKTYSEFMKIFFMCRKYAGIRANMFFSELEEYIATNSVEYADDNDREHIEQMALLSFEKQHTQFSNDYITMFKEMGISEETIKLLMREDDWETEDADNAET